MPSTKKLIFITRPIDLSWNEGSKNFAITLAKKITIPNLTTYILTTKENKRPISTNIFPLSLFKDSNLTFLTKFKMLIFLIKAKADIFHFIFVATPITCIIIKIILFFKRKKSVQTIVSINNNLPSFFLKLMLYGNQIVCLSKTTEEKLKTTGFFNVQAIPPGVDVNVFKPFKKDNLIAFVGELHRMESYAIVEELIPLIIKTFPAYTIALCFRFSNKPPQEYQLREKLKTKIAKFKNRIIWHDVIENMPKFLANTKLVIFPATNMQGKFDFPLVLIEALASGTPAVVSPIKPLSELIIHKGISVAPVNNAISFIGIAKDILNEKSYDDLSKSARKTAIDHFSIQDVARKYQKIYEQFITG